MVGYIDDEFSDESSKNNYYDTMQVCLKGHQITTSYDTDPSNRADYCNKCGSKTIYRCQSCDEKIRGYHVGSVIYIGDIKIPSNCHKCGKAYPWKLKLPTTKKENNLCNNEILETIFSKFSSITIQLRIRYDGRDTLNVKDEYDVQDLLHSLLKLYFDDIRTEEWNPSYAGSSTRSDLLLKDEKIVIEIKHTRKGLTNKKLKDELIIDKEQYKQNNDCETLYCFVYDPNKIIRNTNGFEKDISEKSKNFTCIVIIS